MIELNFDKDLKSTIVVVAVLASEVNLRSQIQIMKVVLDNLLAKWVVFKREYCFDNLFVGESIKEAHSLMDAYRDRFMERLWATQSRRSLIHL